MTSSKLLPGVSPRYRRTLISHGNRKSHLLQALTFLTHTLTWRAGTAQTASPRPLILSSKLPVYRIWSQAKINLVPHSV